MWSRRGLGASSTALFRSCTMSAEGMTQGLRQSKCVVLEFTFKFLRFSCHLGSGYSTCFTWDPRVTLCGWQDFKIQEPKLCVASIFCFHLLFSVGLSGVILQELGCITDIFLRFFFCVCVCVCDLFVLRDHVLGEWERKKSWEELFENSINGELFENGVSQ